MIGPMICKTELLSRLNEIYNQLEELEEVLHSSYQVQQGNVQKLEKNTLDSCTEKVSKLEAEIMRKQVENRKKSLAQPVGSKNIKQTASIHLELGLKGL